MMGTPNNDLLLGTPEADLILALAGDDIALGLVGDDYINGNQDDDQINGNEGNDFVRGGQGDDIVRGGKGNDLVMGDRGRDSLYGDRGNDVIIGGTGELGDPDLDEDFLSGGEGNDVLFGNQGDDTLSGGEGTDALFGGKGNDSISGDAGDDLIAGDLGADTLTGGEGRDIFFIGNDPASPDVITDFSIGEDVIELTDGLSFQKLSRFVAGIGDNEGSTIVQNRETGDILAVLQGVSPNELTQNDFLPLSETPTLSNPSNPGSSGNSGSGSPGIRQEDRNSGNPSNDTPSSTPSGNPSNDTPSSTPSGNPSNDTPSNPEDSTPDPEPEANLDQTAPTATLVNSDNLDLTVVVGDSSSYSVTVTYADDVAVDVSTLDVNDIVIQIPDESEINPKSISTSLESDGTVQVTYEFDPPGGNWEVSESGEYIIFTNNSQVSDTSENFVAGFELGRFQVNAIDLDTPVNFDNENEGIIVRLDEGFVYKSEYGIAPKVLPTGDSITQGVDGVTPDAEQEGYRIPLWNKLRDFGLEVEFVGSQSNGPSNLGPEATSHEGHPGKQIGFIKDNIEGWITAEEPDAILVKIGTNNITGSTNTDAGPTLIKLRQLLNTITKSNTDDLNDGFDGELLVASIPPFHPTERTAEEIGKVANYNAGIPDEIARQIDRDPSKKVSFVDINAALTAPDDLADTSVDNGLHPNAQGYEKIAQAWYDALITKLGTQENLSNVDDLTGSPHDDVIVGNDNNNTLNGGDGADRITGGAGADILIGGAGADRFIYNNPNEGVDTIFGWTSEDIFQISASGFGGGLSVGVAPEFVNGASPQATVAGAQFLYDTSSGSLSFDADGTGGGLAINLATLIDAPALAVNQLEIIA